jgi:phospholipase/carboxylesterase
MLDNLVDLSIGDWVLKARIPDGDGPHPVILLVHGWTGDERSMWVFGPRMPRNALLVAMRAPYISNHPEIGGYSWVTDRVDGWSNLADFAPALDAFSSLVAELPAHLDGDFGHFGLMGFSQGAAFSFAFSLQNRDRVARLAALAGFMPHGVGDLSASQPMAGLPVYIAHGTQDEKVPIARAHQAAELAAAAGAQVRSCESDTGHKIGAECARELAAFFQHD